MATKNKPAPTKGKGDKQKTNKTTQKIYKIYEISGDTAKKKNKSCPKCGPGTFMANHKDRSSCGKCAYMEKK